MSRFLRITLTTGLVLTLGIASILGAYSIVNAATGGPDAYGYYYMDDGEPPLTYSWLDISGTGTPLVFGDDDCAPFPIGFTFNFYGVPYTNVNISSNGLLNFGTCWWDYDNQQLPDAGNPEPIIAVFWDDLDPGEPGAEVYYETKGSSPNRTFVVQWNNVPHWISGGGVGDSTFEVILYEGSNEILMQYADTDFGDATYDDGVSATVGIQGDVTKYLEYSFNSPNIPTFRAILFHLPSANNPPDTPTLNSPSDGATGVALTPNLIFDYSDPDGNPCASFNLQVDNDLAFGSPEINEAGYAVGGPWLSGNPITYSVATPLAPGIQYYWRVDVFDGALWSGWSAGDWDFTIGDAGSVTDTYYPTDDVTVSGTGFPPGTNVNVYVVQDFAWVNGDPIPQVPSPVFAFNTFLTDGSGRIGFPTPEVIWSAPLTIGSYDIVFDVNQDVFYNDASDFIDNPHAPGFVVMAAPPPPGAKGVGGEVYPIDKAALLLPWLGLGVAMVLAAGGLILIRRRS